MIQDFPSSLTSRSLTTYNNALKGLNVEDIEMQTATVYLVTSPLAVTKPITWYARLINGPGLFHFLNGTNTTHWGLRIRGRSYDLKRTADHSSMEAVPNKLRREREILTESPSGKTHFADEQLVVIGLFSGLSSAD